jgi:hypothetical protein
VLAVAVSAPVAAQEVDPQKLAEVKAGFILNFVRYTTWPVPVNEGGVTPCRVTVVGDHLLAEHLEAMVQRSGPVDGRALEITPVRTLAAARPEERDTLTNVLMRSHVVYVTDSRLDDVLPLLPRLASAGVLTIGEGAGFAAAGGMIGLWRDGERVVFDANPDVIRESPIAVSARVLKLARLVTTGGGE